MMGMERLSNGMVLVWVRVLSDLLQHDGNFLVESLT